MIIGFDVRSAQVYRYSEVGRIQTIRAWYDFFFPFFSTLSTVASVRSALGVVGLNNPNTCWSRRAISRQLVIGMDLIVSIRVSTMQFCQRFRNIS